MAKFNLENAIQEVITKAEEMYKGSEITSDVIVKVIDKYFNKTYTLRQQNLIKEYFMEQEKIINSEFEELFPLDESKEKFVELKENKSISIKGLENKQNIADTFKNYKAFENNFGPIVIVKDGKHFLIYRPDAASDSEYINHADSKDYIEGWLYGMVQANNKIVKSIR